MKSITFFICSLSSGGAEHQLSVLANALQKKGYNVTIVTFAGSDDHYELDNKIERVRLNSSNSVLTFIKIFNYFLTLRTDCIISFGQRENVISLIPNLLRKTKFIAGERNFTIGKSSFIEKLLFNYLYKRADYIIPNSYSQKKHILKQHPEFKQKCKTITNYTDLDLYTFSSSPNNEIPRIGVFCRYSPQKNCLNFIQAIAEFRQKYPNKLFKVEWYGSKKFKTGEQKSYFDLIVNTANALDINDVLSFNDSVKNVKDLMPLFDAIALPSFFEGFSNSISEAICCGKPMVVSDVSDNSIMVHNGHNGYLFNPNSVSEITDALYKLLGLSKEELNIFGLRSRRIAECLFNKDKFVKSYIGIIEEYA